MIKKEVIGDCTLYLGDCLEIMPTLGKVEAVVTDPPYGIGADKGKKIIGKGSFKNQKSRTYEDNWDVQRPDKEIFDLILEQSNYSIIWGGNYFADYLPAMGKWLWWDKCQSMPTYGDGELAWTNLPGKVPKKFTYSNHQLLADRVERFHPTQKPLPLIKWCIAQIKDVKEIIDPFMGGGTTGIACAEMGVNFIGIEIDEKYFNISCKRIKQAYDQYKLF